MKEKSQSTKLPVNVPFKASTSNLFLNIIIFLLGIIILVMLYSIYTKITFGGNDGNAAELKNNSRIIQVEVLNGCGRSGIADIFTEFLRKHHFDVVHQGNYISFDVDNSMVIDRTGNKKNAEKVAGVLGIDKKHIITQINNDYFLDVSVIIGKDYNKLNFNK